MASGFPFNDVLRTGVPRTFAPPPRPRAPPRFIRPPTPVLMERPQPLVPDVSLLSIASTGGGPSFHSNSEDLHLLQDSSHFDNSSPNYYNYVPTPPSQQNAATYKNSSSLPLNDSGHGTSASRSHDNFQERNSLAHLNLNDSSLNTSKKSRSSSKSPSPPPPLSKNQYESLKTELSSVHSVVNNQSNLIANLNAQFSQMLQLQEKLFAQLTAKNSTITNSTKSVQTQTDSSHLRPKSPPQAPQSTKPQVHLTRTPSLKKLKPPETTSKPEKPIDPPADSSSKRTAADFSTVLRNLQISNVQAPSLYSETSGVKSIDCPPFTEEDSFQNDSIGPSASAQGSDLEEDDPQELLPSVTYYNNLITTVNRILDSGPPQKTTPSPPPSNPSKTHQKIPSKNSSTSSGSTASYTNYSNGQPFKENIHPPGGGSGGPPIDSVQSTKRYLQSIGVQFDSPSSPTPNQPPPPGPPSQKNHPQNYMIQQNVYNSIYIPTVNCVPIGGGGGGGLPDSFNSNSGVLDNLAKKYLPSGERNQYEYDLMQSKRKEPAAIAGAETTVYGMSPGNLSFATREYLQRHGLVDSNSTPSAHPQQSGPPPPPQHHHQAMPPRLSPPQNNFNGNYLQSDKILDMTAIRNQPKLL